MLYIVGVDVGGVLADVADARVGNSEGCCKEGEFIKPTLCRQLAHLAGS